MKLLSRIRSLIVPSETIHGYEQPELIEVIFQKTKAYQPNTAWDESAKTVLDFGGGCGLHYKEARLDARWAVVETGAMVQRAQELATGQLQFFTSVKAAADWLGEIDLMHSNGALQYTQDPEAVLNDLVSLRAKVMLWKRVSLSASKRVGMQTSRRQRAWKGQHQEQTRDISRYPNFREGLSGGPPRIPSCRATRQQFQIRQSIRMM
jgi:putative methyltransferase (TIGR04325 family)